MNKYVAADLFTVTIEILNVIFHFLQCIRKDVYINFFALDRLALIVCFQLFACRICSFFSASYARCFSSFISLSCNSLSCSGCSALCGVTPNQKNNICMNKANYRKTRQKLLFEVAGGFLNNVNNYHWVAVVTHDNPALAFASGRYLGDVTMKASYNLRDFK